MKGVPKKSLIGASDKLDKKSMLPLLPTTESMGTKNYFSSTYYPTSTSS